MLGNRQMGKRSDHYVISREFQILSDEAAARVAHILGDQSAMTKAIADRDRRRESGEDAVILMRGQTILVGPRPCEDR